MSDRQTQVREGFEAQRKAGINVDWFTWQIAWHDALFTVHDAAARQPDSVQQEAETNLRDSATWSKGEQEAFEAWQKSKPYLQDGEWAAWQGRAAIAQKAVAVAVEPSALPQAVLDALRFYASGHHYTIDDDCQQFDTLSGEAQNWLVSERDEDSTMIEDGSVAKAVLLGGLPGLAGPTEPIEGEVFVAALNAPAPIAPTNPAAEGCQCRACAVGVTHASDCSVHNMPAMPNGPCDCAPIASPGEVMKRNAERYRWLRAHWGYLLETYDGDTTRMVSIDLIQESCVEEGWPVDPVSLDEAVDAALAQTSREKS